MFYKDIITFKDQDDDEYDDDCTELSKKFCYKTGLIRATEHSKLIMEIYIPILLKKATEKLEKLERKS